MHIPLMNFISLFNVFLLPARYITKYITILNPLLYDIPYYVIFCMRCHWLLFHWLCKPARKAAPKCAHLTRCNPF